MKIKLTQLALGLLAYTLSSTAHASVATLPELCTAGTQTINAINSLTQAGVGKILLEKNNLSNEIHEAFQGLEVREEMIDVLDIRTDVIYGLVNQILNVNSRLQGENAIDPIVRYLDYLHSAARILNDHTCDPEEIHI